MRPQEFIARIIDLFDFNLGPNWSNAQPDDLLTAHLQIMAARKTPGFDDVRKIVNSYLFVLEAASELGVCILRASMVSVPFKKDNHRPLNQPLMEGLRATICFIADKCEPNFPHHAEEDNSDYMFETWHLPSLHAIGPSKSNDDYQELIEMLTWLLLKTNYRLIKTSS